MRIVLNKRENLSFLFSFSFKFLLATYNQFWIQIDFFGKIFEILKTLKKSTVARALSISNFDFVLKYSSAFYLYSRLLSWWILLYVLDPTIWVCFKCQLELQLYHKTLLPIPI